MGFSIDWKAVTQQIKDALRTPSKRSIVVYSALPHPHRSRSILEHALLGALMSKTPRDFQSSQMSIIQRSAKLFMRPLRRQCNRLLKYGTVTEKMEQNSDDHLVWIDLEMTGLDIDTGSIMEVACLITDQRLNIISNEFNVIINHSDKTLETMDEWCVRQHGKSGLTQACKNSQISLCTAEKELLKFLKSYVPERKCPIAGNSVYMDRLFIMKYMPSVHEYLHYRIIDTSTIKELSRRWNPEVYKLAPLKALTHRAIDDIRESIQELKFYRCNIFKLSDQSSR